MGVLYKKLDVIKMKKFRTKPEIVEAEQWFKVEYLDKEGNKTDIVEPPLRYSLDVGYYRHPSYPGSTLCHLCHKPLHAHGWIGHHMMSCTVCPGNYVIKHEDGIYTSCNPDLFKENYEVFEE